MSISNMTIYDHFFNIIYIHFWDPSLNCVISKTCYNEPCYKEVVVYHICMSPYCGVLRMKIFCKLQLLIYIEN